MVAFEESLSGESVRAHSAFGEKKSNGPPYRVEEIELFLTAAHPYRALRVHLCVHQCCSTP